MEITPRLAPSKRSGFEHQIAAPAKINRFLHVLGRRADGYHELQTGFELLDWGDTLHYRPGGAFDIQGMPELADQDNLIYRAAFALADLANITPTGTMAIDKIIPSGAGLGGGSSNAASTLLMLNQLWKLNLTIDQLAALGRDLGADVPVFVRGQGAIATGIGEHLTPIQWPIRRLLLCVPKVFVPTPTIFNAKGLTRNSQPIRIRAALADQGHNDCESCCRNLFPEVDAVFHALVQHQPKLSGTGGSVFVELSAKDDADTLIQKLPNEVRFWVVSTTQYSPAVKT